MNPFTWLSIRKSKMLADSMEKVEINDAVEDSTLTIYVDMQETDDTDTALSELHHQNNRPPRNWSIERGDLREVLFPKKGEGSRKGMFANFDEVHAITTNVVLGFAKTYLEDYFQQEHYH